jgi:integrase
MPRLVRKVPAYRKHHSGQAIVVLNHKTHYLGKYGTKSSRMLYDRLVAEWLSRDRTPDYSAESEPILLKAVIAAYWRHCKTHYRTPSGEPSKTLDGIRYLLKPLRRLYGDVPAEDFGPRAFKAAIHQFIQGKSRRTGNMFISRVKAMFRWATSEELVSADLFTRICAVKGLEKGRSEASETAPVEAVADEVVNATVKYLPRMVSDMVQLQRLIGARPGEIVSMKGSEIDRSGLHWFYSPTLHKTSHKGKSRAMAIPRKGCEILAKYLESDPVGYCFKPKQSEAHRRAIANALRVTPKNAGNAPGRRSGKPLPKRKFLEHYAVGTYRKAIERAAEKAKVAKWSPNQLRHAAAEEIQEKLGIEFVQAQLGHSTKAMSRHYAKQNRKLLEQVAQVQS